LPAKRKKASEVVAEAERRQIVVLGMHRSGTSCVGNLLTRLGAYFGDAAISTGAAPENPKGFFERRDVREVCDTILQGSGCDWWSVNDFSPERVPAAVRAEANEKFARVLEDLEAHRPWFIKEPRLCLTFPLLARQVANPVFVLVWRRPLEVAQSLAVRNGFPIDFGLALWEAYVRAALATSRGKPTVVVSYNDLVAEPYAQAERLGQALRDLGVGGMMLPARAAVAEAVDPALHRNRSEPRDLAELLTPSQQRLVEALAGGRTGHPAFDEPLSAAARVRLADWARREGVMLELRRAASGGTRAAQQAAKLEAEIESRNRKLAELNEQLAERNREKAERERRQQQALAETARLLERSRGEWEAERRQLIAALDRRDAEAAQTKSELARTQEQRRQALDAIRALEESQQQSNAEHAQLTAELAQGEESRRALEAELARGASGDRRAGRHGRGAARRAGRHFGAAGGAHRRAQARSPAHRRLAGEAEAPPPYTGGTHRGRGRPAHRARRDRARD
jgi:hypothetical protein